MARSDSQPDAVDRESLTAQSLGEAMRLLRHRARLSRAELSRLAAVSTGAISGYENGTSVPSLVSLRRIIAALADALDVDVNDLWTRFGSMLAENA